MAERFLQAGQTQENFLTERLNGSPVAKLDSILSRYNKIVLPSARRDLRTLQLGLKRDYSWQHEIHVESGEEEAQRVFSHQQGRFPIPIDLVARFRLGDYNVEALLAELGLYKGMGGVLEMEELMQMSGNPEKYRRVLGYPTKIPGIALNFSKSDQWRYVQVTFDQRAAVAIILSPALAQLSDWYKDRETFVEESLYTYYNAIDNGDFNSALAIFDQDKRGRPKVTYVRGNRELVGGKQIRDFYEKERVLFVGKHDLGPFQISGDEADVEGVFTGVQLNRRRVQFRFTDHFIFRGERVIRRESAFPDGLQH